MDWRKDFDKKFDGLWLFLATEYKSFDAGKAPKESIKSFIRETLSNREHEIAEEVDMLTRYERSIFRLNASDVMGEGVKPMLLEEEVLSILKH